MNERAGRNTPRSAAEVQSRRSRSLHQLPIDPFGLRLAKAMQTVGQPAVTARASTVNGNGNGNIGNADGFGQYVASFATSTTAFGWVRR